MKLVCNVFAVVEKIEKMTDFLSDITADVESCFSSSFCSQYNLLRQMVFWLGKYKFTVSAINAICKHPYPRKSQPIKQTEGVEMCWGIPACIFAWLPEQERREDNKAAVCNGVCSDGYAVAVTCRILRIKKWGRNEHMDISGCAALPFFKFRCACGGVGAWLIQGLYRCGTWNYLVVMFIKKKLCHCWIKTRWTKVS